MEFLEGLAWGALVAGGAWLSGMAGLAFSFWRDRRAGRPYDWDRDW